MIYRILAVIYLLVVTVIHSDPLTVDVEIQCAFNMLNWCGHLHLYQENQPIIRYEEFCTTDVIKRFHYSDINCYGDQSPTYELKYQLHHNCTPDVFWRCLIPEEPVGVNGEWNKNEILGEQEFCGVPEGVKEVDFDFSLEKYALREYKINYQLTHNCTIDDLTRCIRPDYFTTFNPNIMSKMEFKFNAWNYGEARACIHPHNLIKFSDWHEICEKVFE